MQTEIARTPVTTHTAPRCAIIGCSNNGTDDVFVPQVVDKQIAIIEDAYDGAKMRYPAVVWHPDGPAVVKKVLAVMCPRHSPYWEAAPEA
jgi:hypothetical protein